MFATMLMLMLMLMLMVHRAKQDASYTYRAYLVCTAAVRKVHAQIDCLFLSQLASFGRDANVGWYSDEAFFLFRRSASRHETVSHHTPKASHRIANRWYHTRHPPPLPTKSSSHTQTHRRNSELSCMSPTPKTQHRYWTLFTVSSLVQIPFLGYKFARNHGN